jgi:uncharacterized membrane protein
VTQLLRRTAVLAVFAFAACDDDDPVSPPGTLGVTASRTDLTVTQGGSDTLTLNVTRGGSFSGPVTLTATGAPDGATVTLASPTLASGVTSTTATVTVVAAVAPGTYPITITAAGTGISTNPTTTINLTVTAAQVADFSVASSVDTLNVTPGDSATLYLRATRTGGFAGALALATDSLPAGWTVAFTDTSLAGDSTLVTLYADSSVTESFDLVLRGTSDTTARTDTVRVNVAIPAGFSLGLEPDTLSLVAGTNGQVVVRANRMGGLADTVNLVIAGQPGGVTGMFGSAALDGDSTVLTIATDDTVAAGEYAIAVTGTAGTVVSTDTLYLTVSAPPAGNSLSLALTPASDSIAAGTTDTIAVVATRTGFAGPVMLTTDSLPAGVTVTIDSAGIAGDTLLVPITVDSTAVAGTYTITFVGSAAGVASDSATYSLVVTAAGGSSGRVGASASTATLSPIAGTRRTRTAVRRP